MDKQSDPSRKKSGFLALFTRNYSGPLTGVALSALSAWMIVTGLKGLAGFEVTRESALADLLGIILIIGVARWMRPKAR
ncbi:MAG TPA: hypothetical protein VJ698_18285 [Noviherbaspirillum sp.]|uniref:hypothetical protein n=1 Tax=Noviherbaspirillum sp. TaxID=1926288 RepID=UPI002B4A0FD9|nr:hypothetical protein [Noviherbaspirillum sp.]HJV87423.1 hypothetical protein [Noviherbaspirillum sp.]